MSISSYIYYGTIIYKTRIYAKLKSIYPIVFIVKFFKLLVMYIPASPLPPSPVG
jgi:hypothetical protein